MKAKLTRAFVKDATLAELATGADMVIWDEAITGFGLRLRASGRKTFVLRYPIGRRGNGRWLKIGNLGSAWRPDPVTGRPRVLTLDLARDEALRLLGERVNGRDPAEVRDAERAIPTVGEFAKRYNKEYSEVHKAATTAKGELGIIEATIIPKWGSVRLDKLDADTLIRWHVSRQDAPAYANRVVITLAGMYTQAKEWRVVPADFVSPTGAVTKYPKKKRDRFLTRDEVKRIGESLHLVAPSHGAALLCLMYTGARANEVLRLKRSAMNWETGVALIRRKGRGETLLPLNFPPEAVEALKTLPNDDSEYFFPGDTARSKVPGPAMLCTLERAWHKVRKAAGIPDVRIHDLRHSFASFGNAEGLGLKELADVLGHADIRTTQGYVHAFEGASSKAAATVAATIGLALKGAKPVPAAHAPTTAADFTAARQRRRAAR